jgi:hypothetical protein
MPKDQKKIKYPACCFSRKRGGSVHGARKSYERKSALVEPTIIRSGGFDPALFTAHGEFQDLNIVLNNRSSGKEGYA